ncbi:hypothetical protein ACE6H2_025188 [Prunus campanulata]
MKYEWLTQFDLLYNHLHHNLIKSQYSPVPLYCIHPLNKTMADLTFPLATKLNEKLGSVASDKICLAWGVKADLKKLNAQCQPSKMSSCIGDGTDLE